MKYIRLHYVSWAFHQKYVCMVKKTPRLFPSDTVLDEQFYDSMLVMPMQHMKYRFKQLLCISLIANVF